MNIFNKGNSKLSKKIILLGQFGVGKSSLIEKFVHQEFSEMYITTIGVKIDKKEVQLGGRKYSLLIWDIAGEDTQIKVPTAYKLGAHGAIFVFDLTMPSSFENLEHDIAYMKKIIPPIPFVLVGNKTDLVDEAEMARIKEIVPHNDYIYSSAKTGENVESIFTSLVKKMAK